MAFTLLFSLLLVHHIQKDPSSTGICTKTMFQDVMGEKARQPALEFIIQCGIPFRVTQFPPEKNGEFCSERHGRRETVLSSLLPNLRVSGTPA